MAQILYIGTPPVEHPIVSNDFGSLSYEIKRKVPSGPDPIQSPRTPPVEHPTVSNDFGSLNYEIKRTVPKGPNPIKSPTAPPMEHPLGPSGTETLESPLQKYNNMLP